MEVSKINRQYIIWLVSDMMAYYDHHIRKLGKLMLTLHRFNQKGTSILIKILDSMTTYIQMKYRRITKGYSYNEYIP